MSFDLGPALLFCPADRPERYAKAFDRADAVILDLEDAVPPDAKEQARVLVARALAEHPAWVRVNAAGSDLCAADLDAVAGRALGIKIPKLETPRTSGGSPTGSRVRRSSALSRPLAECSPPPRSRPCPGCATWPWAASTCSGT
jgi:citrate lyase subunit beta / citryl-CoA lyase